jgi:hypothetical protein
MADPILLASSHPEPEVQPPSQLLYLAAELRNKIYAYALSEDDRIIITAESIPEPALLFACKQIRKEAIGIYYDISTFKIEGQPCDSRPLVLYTRKTKSLLAQGKSPNRDIVANGLFERQAQDWTMLKVCLKRFHAGKCEYGARPPSQVSSKDSALKLVCSLFSMVDKMRKL